MASGLEAFIVWICLAHNKYDAGHKAVKHCADRYYAQERKKLYSAKIRLPIRPNFGAMIMLFHA